MYRYLPLVGVAVLLIAAGCGESIPRIAITEVADGQDGSLSVKYTAREFFGADIDIVANYTTDTVILGIATSKGGDGTVGLTTSESGTAHTFIWDYKTDLGIGRHRGVYFTIVPYGPDGRGRSGYVGPFDIGLPLLFTANEGANTISIVDIGAGQVSSTASVGNSPAGIVALPDESKLYVTNSADNTVSIVDIQDPTLVSSLVVGTSPAGIAVSPDGTRVYVVNSGDGTVSVIDSSLTTPAVVDTYTVGASPVACSLTENGQTLFVTNSGDGTLSILAAADGSSLISPISVGSNPRGVATGSRYTVVCNYDSGTVSVIDNSAIVTTPPQVAVDSEPVAVAMDELSTFAYVANYGSDSISVVNLDVLTVVGTIDLSDIGSKGPRSLTLDSNCTYLYVTYKISSQLAKVDVSALAILSTFSVGTNPVGLVILSE
jgi:YVTN family beta-propeller protein